MNKSIQTEDEAQPITVELLYRDISSPSTGTLKKQLLPINEGKTGINLKHKSISDLCQSFNREFLADNFFYFRLIEVRSGIIYKCATEICWKMQEPKWM